jgi:hypothetical protein
MQEFQPPCGVHAFFWNNKNDFSTNDCLFTPYRASQIEKVWGKPINADW